MTSVGWNKRFCQFFAAYKIKEPRNFYGNRAVFILQKTGYFYQFSAVGAHFASKVCAALDAADSRGGQLGLALWACHPSFLIVCLRSFITDAAKRSMGWA